MLRIIAGKWRGRRLVPPPADVTRPSTDRLREALFSSLTSRLGSFEGLSVVDAFAGSGALGFEALSRGAVTLLCAEKHPKTRQVLLTNGNALGILEDASTDSSKNARAFFYNDYTHFPKAAHSFDVIFLDPPYGQGLEYTCLDFLQQQGYTDQETLIVLETKADAAPSELKNYQLIDIRIYGSSAISLWALV